MIEPHHPLTLQAIPCDRVQMVQAISCTFNGKLISVSYQLKVYIKHDSWNELGSGKKVVFPVMILQPPMQMQP